VFYGSRIVIPSASRRGILEKLHLSHQGIVRTKRRAQQSVYWPGISNDIMMLVERCDICQERLASQAQEPLLVDPLPSYVFEDVSQTYFNTDRYTCWSMGTCNGHAEAAVKTVKELVVKLAPSGVIVGRFLCWLAGISKHPACNWIVTGPNCIRPSPPVHGARPSIFLLQSMERSHGRARTSGESRCEHKIPLRAE